jgi:enoyl-CoA hydratase/carnithine racemase
MIRVEDGPGLRVLRIDREEKRGALTGEMLEALIEGVEGAPEGLRMLALTGTGRTFSAGADLEEARAGLATSPLWEWLSGAVAACPVPTVAALNGTLAGGAFGMALACDVRICAPEARFFYPVARLGYLPQPSDPGRLAALVGPARARLLLVLGARWDAAEALAFGLVDRIRDDPLAEARALLDGLDGADPAHLAAIGRMVPAPG